MFRTRRAEGGSGYTPTLHVPGRGIFPSPIHMECFRVDRKRIVITGLSAITPLGTNLESSWEALLAGKSGIGRISQFDSTEFPTHIAGEVKDFTPEEFIPAKQCRKMDRF